MDIMLERILELVGTKHGAKKELMDALQLPPNLVTEWKQGRVKSYPKYAAKIADYYDVSLDWLSGNTDDKSKKPATQKGDELSEAEVEIIMQYRAASDEMKAVMRKIAGIE